MSNQQERRHVKRIDCYQQSILSTDIKHSLVVDINNEGAGLLILKEKSLFKKVKAEDRAVISGNVHLNIFHPDSSLQKGISIDAEVVWVDYDYSKDHQKIGVKFIEMDGAQVDQLTNWLSKEGNYYFHCELQKR